MSSVNSIPDAELLRLAVTNARDRQRRKGEKHPRWTAVKSVFQLGSNYSMELCARFGLDPDEEVNQ